LAEGVVARANRARCLRLRAGGDETYNGIMATHPVDPLEELRAPDLDLSMEVAKLLSPEVTVWPSLVPWPSSVPPHGEMTAPAVNDAVQAARAPRSIIRGQRSLSRRESRR
jgi:hypothetical protein